MTTINVTQRPNIIRTSSGAKIIVSGGRGLPGRDGTGIVWRGEWSASTQYAALDSVAYNGSSYVASEPNLNDPPPSANWTQSAAKGDAGPNQVSTSTTTNITGILKGNGATVSAAQAGTDYETAGAAAAAQAASEPKIANPDTDGKALVSTAAGVRSWVTLFTKTAADALYDAIGAAAAVASNLASHIGLTTAAHGGVVASNDSRLTDSRTPTAHKTTHATGGTDALSPSDIGAAASAHNQGADTITSGTLDGDRLPGLSASKRGGVPATGTPSGKFLKDDGTWATTGGGAVDSVNGHTGTVVLGASDVGADSAGAAAAAQAASEPKLSNPDADGKALVSTTGGVRSWVALFTKTAADLLYDAAGAAASVASSLSSHTSATGTSVHGLGTASTHASTDFDAAGAAASAQAASEPKLTNPDVDGKALVSTAAGVRSWAALFTKAAADLLYDAAGAAAAVAGNLSTHSGLTTTAHGGIVASNDARLTDSRTPTAHKTSHATGGSDALTYTDVGADASGAAAGVQSNLTTHANATGTNVHGLGDSATKNVGTTTGTVAAGDDSRLSNARTPTAHAASHATGQSDPITPANIGADVAGAAAAVAGNLSTHAGLTTTAHGGIVSPSSTDTLTNKTINDITNFVDANATHTKVYNNTGVTITKGQALYVVGWDAGTSAIIVGLARANSASTMPCIGLAEANIAHLATGEMRTSGTLTGINTSAFSTADKVYVSSTTAGGLTNTEPSSNAQLIGIVGNQHASAGTIEIARDPESENYTGSGNYVKATSPTLVTPVLGTPASGTLTNCTGLPITGEMVFRLVGVGQIVQVGDKVGVRLPVGVTITGAYLRSDVSTTATVDVRNAAYGTDPVAGDSITASATPALSGATNSADTTLTGWTTAISAGRELWAYVSANSAANWLQLCLQYTRAS